MVKTKLTHDRSQAGFTLVELAIVMIIIGLLIGGILKGQELIANAQITATASQVKAVEAAMTTFRDSYDAVPGDMINPDNRLPNCTAANTACSTDGNGNMRIAESPDDAAAANSEATRFWTQLAAADLIGGVSNNPATITWGDALPAAEIAGGLTVGYAAAVADLVGAAATTANSGHYLAIRNAPATAIVASEANAALRPTQGARIDRKLDDGIANAGSVRGAGSNGTGATNCYNADVYNENNGASVCQLYMRIQ